MAVAKFASAGYGKGLSRSIVQSTVALLDLERDGATARRELRGLTVAPGRAREDLPCHQPSTRADDCCVITPSDGSRQMNGAIRLRHLALRNRAPTRPVKPTWSRSPNPPDSAAGHRRPRKHRAVAGGTADPVAGRPTPVAKDGIIAPDARPSDSFGGWRGRAVRTPVYLDYAATTPADPAVVAVMSRYLGPDGAFGNPASRLHSFGREAEEAVEQARVHVADLINADPREMVWTSGATESDNLAIKGAVAARAVGGRHIVTSAIEHKAVLDPCLHLERNGFEITRIDPRADGLITPELVESALRDDTTLLSLMHVNNEIGTITDIKGIGQLAYNRGIPFHVDAAQSAARLRLDMQRQHVDFLSLSGHKMYGPKGVGALYVRHRPHARLQPQIHGGGHERGLRSGTLPTHQIAAMGEAARLLATRRDKDAMHIANLQRRFLDQLRRVEHVSVNGNRAHCVPGILNLRFRCVESESLMIALPDIAFSTGSACTSARVEPSHVLRALGLDDDSAHSSVRFSFGRFTTARQIDFAVERIRVAVAELRSLSATWHATCTTDSRATHNPEGGVRVA